MTPLSLFYDCRVRLDDFGGNTGAAPAGYTYYFESDMTLGQWKNQDLVDALNYTLKEIAMRRPIADSTTDTVCEIALVAGQQDYPLDSSILTIEDVSLASTNRSLRKTTLASIRKLMCKSQYSPVITDSWQTTQGVPIYYLENRIHGYLTVVPIPAVADTLNLTVYRLPLDQILWEDRLSDIDDCPEQLREAVIQGMLSWAYNKRDADTQDPKRAAYHAAEFTRLVGPSVSYKQLEDRKWNANLDISIRPYPYAITPRRTRIRGWEGNSWD